MKVIILRGAETPESPLLQLNKIGIKIELFIYKKRIMPIFLI